MMIKVDSNLWQYLSPQQRVLAQDGEFLLKVSLIHPDEEPTDYSYLVFPFAKMYEGYLKQLLLDINLISERDYYSEKFRIGRALSPNFHRRSRHSVYKKIEEKYGKGLATRLWHTWKEGRNLVFHYFPHNLRALSRSQAEILITQIVETMADAVTICKVKPTKRDLSDFYFVGKSPKKWRRDRRKR
ncbi:hypothetical protein ACFL1A_01290 [Patescibacteria group bacterium]